jgi:hypothetical protein
MIFSDVEVAVMVNQICILDFGPISVITSGNPELIETMNGIIRTIDLDFSKKVRILYDGS